MATTYTPTNPDEPGRVVAGGNPVREIHLKINQRQVDAIINLSREIGFREETPEGALLNVIMMIESGRFSA